MYSCDYSNMAESNLYRCVNALQLCSEVMWFMQDKCASIHGVVHLALVVS